MASTPTVSKRAATELVDEPIAKRLRSRSKPDGLTVAKTDSINSDTPALELDVNNSTKPTQSDTSRTSIATHAPDSKAVNNNGLLSPGSDSKEADIPTVEPSKPHPVGRPRAWAEKRGAFANAINDIKHHEGACLTRDNHVVGMMLDGASSPRAMITSDVVITAVTGGRVKDADTGRMVRKDSIDEENASYKSFRNTMEKKRDIHLAIGSKNPEFPVVIPHNFCEMGYFQVTDLWSEVTIGTDGQRFKEWMVRLESLEYSTPPWWHPLGEPYETVPVGQHICPVRTCTECNVRCKEIYAQGWTCCNQRCARHFIFDPPVSPDEVTYSQTFLLERNDQSGFLPLRRAIPPLPSTSTDSTMSYGTEEAFKRGIVCPRCGCCSRRVWWHGWVCENEACDFTHTVPFAAYPISNVLGETDKASRKKHAINTDLVSEWKLDLAGYKATVYRLPDDAGQTIGVVIHMAATRAICELPNGPDDLYQALQPQDSTQNQDQDQTLEQTGMLPLKRAAARAHGSRIEELTSHFICNYGAHYKFGVQVETSPLDKAPQPVLVALSQLIWAQEMTLMRATELVEKEGVDHIKESMPLKNQDFNELLVLGYFEKSSISWHDDGEEDLGPTVATLSLGSPATMRFRPKKRTTIGAASSNKARTKGAVISFALNHGDMVVMHGTLIHKLYEHEVAPAGMLRFAMTSRSIHPKEKSQKKKKAGPGDATPPVEAMQPTGVTLSNEGDILLPDIKTLAYKGNL